MRSGTSFFNRAVYGKTLARFWPVGVLYAAVWFAVLPLNLAGTLQWGGPAEVQQAVLRSITSGGVPLCFLFAAGMAMAVFGWLYNTRSTGFMTSLPIRREALYLSCLAAGLTLLLAGDAVVWLLTAVFEASYRALELQTLLRWLAAVAMMNVAFFGFAAFCAMLTGNILIVPLVFAVFQFAAVAVEETVRYILKYLIYGMGTSQSLLGFLSPAIYLYKNTGCSALAETLTDGSSRAASYFFFGWEALELYAVSGAVLAALGLLLFRRRRMEAASDVVAIPGLKPVFRWCLALAGALGLCACLFLAVSIQQTGGSGGAAPVLLLLLLGGAIGWFLADMLMLKTFRVFRIHWKGLLLFSGIVCVLVLGCEFNVTGYETRLPDAARIDQVQLRGDGIGNLTLTERESIDATVALQKQLIRAKTVQERSGRGNYMALSIEYYGGGEKKTLVMARTYYVSMALDQQADPSSCLRQTEVLANTEEAILSRKAVSSPVTPASIDYAQIYPTQLPSGEEWNSQSLSPQEAYELYTECILPDIRDGTLGRVWLVLDESYAKTVYNRQIEMDIVSRDALGNYNYEYFYTVPTVDSVRTNAWLRARGVMLETLWDVSGDSAGTGTTASAGTAG